MAYSSGTVTTAAGLVSAIQAFATINGWTVAGDYISKGDVYVHLWAESVNEIRIQGARGGTWTAPDICDRYAKLFFAGGYSWPARVIPPVRRCSLRMRHVSERILFIPINRLNGQGFLTRVAVPSARYLRIIS